MKGRIFVCTLAAIALVNCFGPNASALQAEKKQEEAYKALRNRMVDDEVVAAGIVNPRVIKSCRDTPRHEFCPPDQKKNAYYDMALPIGDKQTISPPFVVCYMTEQLDPQPTDNVLEIGTGSGYQAAILSPLVANVYTIEIVEPLAKRAHVVFNRLKYKNIHYKIGDGFKGWPEHAPFDKIIVTCSPEKVPQALIDQLKPGGRLVIPLGERYQQTMYLYRKEGNKLVTEALRPTLFVPMTGAAEDNRQVLPDPKNPKIVNGNFEKFTGTPPWPTGWHYQRHLQLISKDDGVEGERYAYFTNTIPGRNCQALQGMAIDGRQVHEIEITLKVRLSEVRQGRDPRELPSFAILFYDENRKPLNFVTIGPWKGTFDWQSVTGKMLVPQGAREAIVRIGMGGGTGELSADDIQIKVTK